MQTNFIILNISNNSNDFNSKYVIKVVTENN